MIMTDIRSQLCCKTSSAHTHRARPSVATEMGSSQAYSSPIRSVVGSESIHKISRVYDVCAKAVSSYIKLRVEKIPYI